MQNLLVLDVRNDQLQQACDRLAHAPTAEIDASNLRFCTVACTGHKFCEMARVETKEFASSCIDQLERMGAIPDVPLKIAFSGCSNDCGHAQAADIGVIGAQHRDADNYIDYFDLSVGGKLGPRSAPIEKIRTGVPGENVAAEIGRLVERFNENRRPEESFPDFARRYIVDRPADYDI